MKINNFFDTTKPIIEQLAEYADAHKGELPDHIFSQAVSEYEADEDEVMQAMLHCQTHQFSRYSEGFTVTAGPTQID